MNKVPNDDLENIHPFEKRSFAKLYIILRRYPGRIIGGFWTFFTVIGANELVKYFPNTGKLIAIVPGITLGVLSYIAISKKKNLSEEELLHKETPLYLHVLLWLSIFLIWGYAIFSVQ